MIIIIIIAKKLKGKTKRRQMRKKEKKKRKNPSKNTGLTSYRVHFKDGCGRKTTDKRKEIITDTL